MNATCTQQTVRLDSASPLGTPQAHYGLGRRRERLARLGIVEAPMGYVDGMSLYEYVGSSPASATDPLGLQATTAPTTQPATQPASLGMEVVNVSQKWDDTSGAEFLVKWVFPADKKGAVVQHVKIEYRVDIDGGRELRNSPYEYWEAWLVDNGTIQKGFSDGGKSVNITQGTHHDAFKIGKDLVIQKIGKGCKGKVKMTGEAAFIEDFAVNSSDPVWMLVDRDPNVPVYHHEPTGGRLGNLPFRKTPPPGWEKRGPTVVHWLQVEWDFTGGNSKMEVTASHNA